MGIGIGLPVAPRRGMLGQGGAAGPWYQNGSALANSLVALWPLDEVSGTRRDVIGGNTLTDNNTVTSNTGLVYPLAGEFTAANSESLSIADNPALSMGDINFWMACWFRPTTVGAYHPLIGKTDTEAANISEYNLYLDNANKAAIEIGNGVATGSKVTANTASISNYHLFIGWHDSVNNLVGVQLDNGSPATAAYSGGSYDSTKPLRIGTWSNATHFANGRMGPIMIGKNYLPSAADIVFLYNGGLGR